MARNLNGSSDLMQVNVALVSNYPFSAAVWFYPDSFAATGYLAGLQRATAGLPYFSHSLAVAATSGKVLADSYYDAGVPTYGQALSVGGANVGAWNHAGGCGPAPPRGRCSSTA